MQVATVSSLRRSYKSSEDTVVHLLRAPQLVTRVDLTVADPRGRFAKAVHVYSVPVPTAALSSSSSSSASSSLPASSASLSSYASYAPAVASSSFASSSSTASGGGGGGGGGAEPLTAAAFVGKSDRRGWERVATLHLPKGGLSASAELPVALASHCLAFEFADFHRTAGTAGGALLCPRCGREVAGAHGICGACSEVTTLLQTFIFSFLVIECCFPCF